MYKPLVDVQIVNYKTADYLPKCVESVYQDAENSDVGITVHIADNASGDDLSAVQRQFPQTYISYLEHNIGYGAANNYLSCCGSVSPFILILNPDTVITQPNTLKQLLKRLRFGEYQVVGPRLLTLDGKTQEWDHGHLGGGTRGRIARALGRSMWREQSQPIEAAWVSGACFLISRRVFTEIGGFDEKFFLYKEEEDLCLRLRQAGHRVLYDPTVSVLHHGSVVASKDTYMADSERYFIEKHCGRFKRFARLVLCWKP